MEIGAVFTCVWAYLHSPFASSFSFIITLPPYLAASLFLFTLAAPRGGLMGWR